MNFRYLSAGWLAGIRQGLMGQQWVADCSKLLPLRTTSLSKDAKYLSNLKTQDHFRSPRGSPKSSVSGGPAILGPRPPPGPRYVSHVFPYITGNILVVTSQHWGSGCYPFCSQGSLEVLTHPDITATPSPPSQQGRVGAPSLCNLPGDYKKK